MKVKQKKKIGIIVLAVLLIALAVLGWFAYRAYERYQTQTAETMRLLTALGGDAHAAAGKILNERETLRTSARERLAAVPEQRRAAWEAEDLSLLMLVNAWNPLPEDYEPELEFVFRLQGRDYWLDTRCVPAFRQMLADCRATGALPYLCSAYRTWEKQEQLFNEKVRKLVIEQHYTWENAPEEAAKTVAVPGTSEHQLGLAVDMIDWDHPYLDEEQEQTKSQIWLMEHCWDYGFILRYPNGTTEITGIIYEPWHYRYVGEPFAQEIRRMGLTLEEYLALREGR